MFIDLTPSIESGAQNPGGPLCAALQGCVARAFRVESATGGKRPAQIYAATRKRKTPGSLPGVKSGTSAPSYIGSTTDSDSARRGSTPRGASSDFKRRSDLAGLTTRSRNEIRTPCCNRAWKAESLRPQRERNKTSSFHDRMQMRLRKRRNGRHEQVKKRKSKGLRLHEGGTESGKVHETRTVTYEIDGHVV